VALPLESLNRRFSQQVSTVGEDALHDRPLLHVYRSSSPTPSISTISARAVSPLRRNVQSVPRWVITPGMLQVSVGPEA
jgi:hypothetical protein